MIEVERPCVHPRHRLAGFDHRCGVPQDVAVMAWRSRDVRPVRLSCSPLRANEATVPIETSELAFDSVALR